MKIRWPSPAMSVAMLALFVALGGTAFASASGRIPVHGARSTAHPTKSRPLKTAALTILNRSLTFDIAARTDGDYVAQCAAGEHAVAGGWQPHTIVRLAQFEGKHPDLPDIWGLQTGPTANGKGWHVMLLNFGKAGDKVDVYAVCAKLTTRR